MKYIYLGISILVLFYFIIPFIFNHFTVWGSIGITIAMAVSLIHLINYKFKKQSKNNEKI
jgi:hypothetical protein